MKRICDAFDRYVRDFYPFAMSRLPEIRCSPPLTKVFIITAKGDWEQTLHFVGKLSGMAKRWAHDAKAIYWMMPETREDRLKMGPEVMSDAYVDYDAYIALHETKLTDRNMLNGDGFYCAMASACIQLAAVKANNLKGAGKVEHDQQATDLYKQFRACISNENFASLYAPQEAKIVIGNAP